MFAHEALKAIIPIFIKYCYCFILFIVFKTLQCYSLIVFNILNLLTAYINEKYYSFLKLTKQFVGVFKLNLYLTYYFT